MVMATSTDGHDWVREFWKGSWIVKVNQGWLSDEASVGQAGPGWKERVLGCNWGYIWSLAPSFLALFPGILFPANMSWAPHLSL